MFDGPHTKRPMIDVGLCLDGLMLSTWWDDAYCFKIIPWEVVILSRGDAIKGVITEMRNNLTNGEWSDALESTVGANTDVQSV